SAGEMRPSGEIAVASAITKPAPPTAREPKCTRCQSSTKPSSQLYWHIGETPMRFRKVTERSWSGSNRVTDGIIVPLRSVSFHLIYPQTIHVSSVANARARILGQI